MRTEHYVIAVEVSMVIPTEDPSEPRLGSAGVELSREVQQCAEAGDGDWLRPGGKVYSAVEVA